MARQMIVNNTPYALLSAVLLACACFFAVMLWQGESALMPYADQEAYTPSFSVRAQVVSVMRVIPLAGVSLRSPCEEPGAEVSDMAR